MNTLFPEKYCVVGLSPMDDVTDYPFLAILKKNGTAVCSTLYISRISECEKTAYNTRYIDYIYAGGIPVAIHVKNNFLQTDSIYYVQTDLLGSWERIVDANKQVVQASHFDPWGNRMNATQWHVADTARSFPFRRGFTGHEHYDRFRIINTGARLYDPVIARFFSPDPYVQDPFSTQSFNRYSYCWNNPVMYTDPTGEFIFIDSWIVGFIHGFFSTGKDRLQTAWNTGWRLMRNDFQLYKGMIASDPNKSTWGRLWEIISRNTYQGIQTSLGFGLAQLANLSEGFGFSNGGIRKIEYAYGATSVSWKSRNWNAVTLGGYINGDESLEASPYNVLFQHEYGHYLQSQEMGYAYLQRVGLPSLLSKDPKTHKYHPIEIDANRRAFMYFNQNVFTEGNIDYWIIRRNPLDPQNISKENDYIPQKTYTDFIHATWYDYLLPMAGAYFGGVWGAVSVALIESLILTLNYNTQY